MSDVERNPPYLIENHPFSDDVAEIETWGDVVRIPPLQLVVWAALTPAGQAELPDRPRWIPTVVDAGCSDNLVIAESHLRDWAGLDPFELKTIGFDKGRTASGEETELLPRIEADLWLYCTTDGASLSHRGPGNRRSPAFRFELDRGFLLFDESQSMPGPPWPLLGAAALHRAGVQLEVDYDALRFSLRVRADRPGGLLID
ncbi:MAG: hypothetical protein ABIP48_05100 [Planctomycetota bacterium]